VTLTSSATAASNVGSYGTTATNAIFGSGLATNYTITYAPNATGLAVTPRAVTLTPVAVSRIYGDANPTTGTATGNAAGLVNGDAVASVTLASSAIATSSVGSYATTASNAIFGSGLATNYAITYAPNATGLAVTTRAVTLTPIAVSRTYGDTNPVNAAATGSAGGLVNGDSVASVAIASAAQSNSGVGTYAVTASNAVFASGSASNYSIAYAANPGGLVVTARGIAVAALPGQAKLVGRPDPVFGYAVTGGSLVAGDAFAGSLVRVPGELPGVYAINQGTLDLGPNYALSYTPASFAVATPVAVATIDRNPAVGAANVAGADFAALLASLPPTAAGPLAPGELPTECVREAAVSGGGATSRIVNRGIRLPQGVVDNCRPGPTSGSL
jgi:outer membrane lipopolysaccharide assembly protein LptE/RlpB